MNIVAIDAQYRALDTMLDESMGEVTPEIEQFMKAIEAYSADNVFKLQSIREELDAFTKICKEKSDEYSAKAKRYGRRSDYYKSMIIAAIQATGKGVVTNGEYRIKLTQNPLKVEVRDEDAVPSEYKTAEVKISWADYEKIKDIVEVKSVKVAVDKTSIGAIYKSAAVELDGVSYEQAPNIRVS